MDPHEVWRQARDAGLLIRSIDPLNAETALQALTIAAPLSHARFFIRNHFPIPRLDAATFHLTVGGLVDRSLRFSLDDLRRMPARTSAVVLECAGNGRSLLRPKVRGGEAWTLGAVGCARWTGVPLSHVLDRAGVQRAAREVVFRGADRGQVPGEAQEMRFERALPLHDMDLSRVLLAYDMDGEPLSAVHGYPLRLIVPGWYGMASVKWLTQIDLVSSPFAGYYQRERYAYRRGGDDGAVRESVTLQRVKALIAEPASGAVARASSLAIHGVAWSGVAPIASVEVRVGRAPWVQAELQPLHQVTGWRCWRLLTSVAARGTIVLRARATDAAGHRQPERPDWNHFGYGNNAIHEVSLRLT